MQRIEEHITQYFQDLYWKNQQPGAWFTEWKGKSLTPEMATWLERPFLLEEIKTAVFSTAPDKAPGPDGFSMAFFQHCWDILKDELALLRDFHSNGKFPEVLMPHLSPSYRRKPD